MSGGPVGARRRGRDQFAFGIDRETLKPIGGFRKQDSVENRPVKIIARNSAIQTPIKTFKPPARVLVIVHLMLGTSNLPLGIPSGNKLRFIKDSTDPLDPTT
jgi:hypothetical protein